MDQSILSVPDSQQYLGGISRTVLYELIDQGAIIRVNIGRRAFVTKSSLDKYVRQLATA